MMPSEYNDDLLRLVANGNKQALDFLQQLHRLSHAVDDLIDVPEQRASTEALLRVFLDTIVVFGGNDFFIAHRQALLPMVILCLSRYEQSVAWEKSNETSQQHMADHFRSDMNLVVEFVALVCGGWNHLRTMLPAIWEKSWQTHHDAEGNPI